MITNPTNINLKFCPSYKKKNYQNVQKMFERVNVQNIEIFRIFLEHFDDNFRTCFFIGPSVKINDQDQLSKENQFYHQIQVAKPL